MLQAGLRGRWQTLARRQLETISLPNGSTRPERFIRDRGNDRDCQPYSRSRAREAFTEQRWNGRPAAEQVDDERFSAEQQASQPAQNHREPARAAGLSVGSNGRPMSRTSRSRKAQVDA